MRGGGKGRWGAAIVSAVAAGFCLATAASAGVVLETDFRRVPAKIQEYGGIDVDDAKGKGWKAAKGGNGDDEPTGFLAIDLQGVKTDLAAGTLDFLLTRGEEYPIETLFSLTNDTGASVYMFKIYWEGATQKNPEILIGNSTGWGDWQTFVDRSRQKRSSVWGASIPFDRGVGRGEDVRVTVTWGRRPADNAIFIDGRRTNTRLQEPFDFGEILKAGRELFVGAHVSQGTRFKYNNRMTSVMRRFSWLDVPTPPDQVPDVATAEPPSIDALEVNMKTVAGFSGSLVAGNRLAVDVKGAAGATGTFDLVHVTDLDRKIVLDWRGFGVYLEKKNFYEPGEIDLRDVSGYLVYVSREPIDPAAVSMEPADPAAPGIAPAARLTVQEQSYTLENLEIGIPYYALVLARMRDGSARTVWATPTGVPLSETVPGVYGGSYVITHQDRFARATVVAHLARDGAAASLVGATPFVVDPALRIAVNTSPEVLRADEKSTSTVTVTVTDANGNPVPAHKIRFLLATTSQYTGVVGGGAFTKQMGAGIEEDYLGETDLFGRVKATYVAGFAAKTAIVVARDMQSNDTGAGVVKSYIQATAQLELEPVGMMAMSAGYEIAVTSSDEWLTADGKSEARITARVTRLGAPVEGHKVSFAVASGTGSIRTVKETTDRDGRARAVYTAGKRIGMVLITATDRTVDISGSVQIELRSDAPAKIAIKLDPAKLPADGRSTAELLVLVTDINDNPNDNTEVEYAITEGGGELREERGLTDKRGEDANTYRAGRDPGRVSIEITVRSTVPSEEEILKARDLALAVTDYDFF